MKNERFAGRDQNVVVILTVEEGQEMLQLHSTNINIPTSNVTPMTEIGGIFTMALSKVRLDSVVTLVTASSTTRRSDKKTRVRMMLSVALRTVVIR